MSQSTREKALDVAKSNISSLFHIEITDKWEAGGQGESLRFDVGDAAEAEERVNELLGRLERVGALVNNAGITADGLFLMMPRKDRDSVINTSLGATT